MSVLLNGVVGVLANKEKSVEDYRQEADILQKASDEDGAKLFWGSNNTPSFNSNGVLQPIVRTALDLSGLYVANARDSSNCAIEWSKDLIKLLKSRKESRQLTFEDNQIIEIAKSCFDKQARLYSAISDEYTKNKDLESAQKYLGAKQNYTQASILLESFLIQAIDFKEYRVYDKPIEEHQKPQAQDNLGNDAAAILIPEIIFES